MVEAAQRELQAAGISEQPGVIVADAGYWHQQQMEHIAGQGIPLDLPKAASASGNSPLPSGGISSRPSCSPIAAVNILTLEGSRELGTVPDRERPSSLRPHPYLENLKLQ